MYLLCLVCTFHLTIEMYRALRGADDIGTGVPTPVVHSPNTGLVHLAPLHTTGPVLGG